MLKIIKNIFITLVLVSFFCGLIFIFYKDNDSFKKLSTSVFKVDKFDEYGKTVRKIESIKKHFNKYVSVSEDSIIYGKKDDKYYLKGKIYKDSVIELEEQDINSDTKFFYIPFLDGYILYDKVSPTTKIINNDSRFKRYIMFNKNIVTKDSFTLYKDGVKYFTFFNSMNFPIIIDDYNDMYYVSYNDSLFSINKDDVTEIAYSHNSEIDNVQSVSVLNYHFVYDPLVEECNQWICHTYDSFRTGNTYFVKLTTENDMGVLSETPLYDFRVNYNVVEYLQQPTAKFLDKENAIEVSWVAPVEHDAQSYDSAGRVVAPAFLYNTPYNGVNSLYSEGYDTVWQTPDGLCVLPENFNMTFQFSPDQHFYYGEDGLYIDEAVLIDSETDGNKHFTIKLNKNKLLFTYGTLTLEKMLYTHTSDAFVLNPTGVVQINDDYIWLDTATWDDNATWTEGGTALERVCNHWWKVQITNSTIKVEEIFPSA
mgnify:CR=1 FL=1